MKTFILRFLPYFKPHIAKFILAMLAGITTALCTALITYLVKPVLDDVFINKNDQMLLILPLIVIVAYLGKSGGMYLQGYLMNYIGQDIIREVRNTLLSHMLKLEMEFFHKMRSGELIARITSDIEAIRNAVSNYISDFVRETITIIALVFVVIYQSPKLAIIGLFLIPIAIFPINLIAKKIKKNSKKMMEQNSDITAKLNEVFQNAELIKAESSEQNEAKHFARANLGFFKINMKVIRLNQLVNPLMEFLGAILIALIIYIGGNEVIEGKMTAGAFFSFVAALFMIYTPLKKLISIYTGAQSAVVAGNRIFEILNREPKIMEGNEEFSGKIESIEFKNINLSYDNLAALNNVNIEFKNNEILALKGKSGSGKSSIVNLILQLYAPNSGEILINGKPLKNYTQKSIHKHIAIVTQKVVIFNDTIAENVAYGREMNESAVISALKQSFAYDFIEKMPNGIYTKLDEAGSNLSGGQRQRIAIARAIYKKAQIIIFDEATSALDEETENAIKRTINLISPDKIIILIAHRPSTLELADKIINIENGNIINIERRSHAKEDR